MIVSERLKAWTKDRSAQGATQASIDRFGSDWNREPVHRRFDDAMASLPPIFTDEQVAETVRILCADHAWVDILVACLSGRMHVYTFFDPPLRSCDSDLSSGRPGL